MATSKLFFHRGDAAARALEFRQETRPQILEQRAVTVRDVRGELAGLSPDEQLRARGFCLVPFTSAHAQQLHKIENQETYRTAETASVPESPESERVREAYFAEVAAEVRRLTGARECFVTQHVCRPGSLDRRPSGNAYTTQYALFAHADVSPRYLEARLRKGRESLQLGNVDIVMFNTWQPVDHVVQQNPLCLLDHRSFATRQHTDAVNVVLGYDVQRAPRRGAADEGDAAGAQQGGAGDDAAKPEILMLSGAHADEQDWGYFSNMTPGEMLLFAQHDMRPGRAPRAFHTSFWDPRGAQAPSHPRRSIELRLVCIFDKQPQQHANL